jgi:hypothetical protein
MPKLPDRAADAVRVLGLGALLFAGKQVQREVFPGVPPPLLVEVDPSASPADVAHAVDAALLAELAVKHGAVQADPVVREELLRSMRQLTDGVASDESSLLDQAAQLGLFQADPVVRERLRFVGEELLLHATERPTPGAATLQQYAQAHAARYTPPPLTSVQLVVLRGADAMVRARALVPLLQTASVAESGVFHEEPLLPRVLHGATPESLALRVGDAARAGIDATAIGRWSRPLGTPYGALIAYVQSRSAPNLPAMSEIAARVAADFEHDTRATQRTAALHTLREKRGVLVKRRAP